MAAVLECCDAETAHPAVNPLHAIGWPKGGGDDDWWHLLHVHPQARPARVAEQHRSGYRVVESAHDEPAPVQSPPDWQRPQADPQQRAVVGDWVLVEGDGATARIVALLPRRTAIRRAAAGEHYRQQYIAANIDTVLILCGLDGDFNPRRIERYLLLVADSGAQPVVVLTKADHADADVPAARASLVEVITQGVPVVALDARDASTATVLAPWLQSGQTAVLVGSSGAGKSTLTNTLLGRRQMKTAGVREHDARGRHTTTYRALLALPSGACLIDTPGMRELKPTGEESLQDPYGDVEALAADCRFRDCRHHDEPGCAVVAAVATGSLSADRHRHYLKLRDEVQQAAQRKSARQAGDDTRPRGGRR